MSIFDKLKGKVTFEKVTRQRGSSKTNPALKRRTKFVNYLGLQLKALKNHPAKRDRKGHRIDFFEQDGKFYFEPRFGSRKVVINENDPETVMALPSREALEDTINVLIAGTNEGELDAALAKAAERAPRKPKAEDQTQDDQAASKTTKRGTKG
jgi:hypothetical protein